MFSAARQLVDELLSHIERVLLVKKEGREVKFRQLFETHFVQQLRCLVWSHKIQVDEQASDIKTIQVVEAIAALLHSVPWFYQELKRQKKMGWPGTTFDWVSMEHFDLSSRDAPFTGAWYWTIFSSTIA